jgi:hypothetical protein
MKPKDHDKDVDAVARELAGLIVQLTEGTVALFDNTIALRRKTREAVDRAWSTRAPEERERVYHELVGRIGVAVEGVVSAFLEARRAARGDEKTTFHSEVTFGLGKQEVGPGQTAYGAKVTIKSDSGATVEIGAGVIPRIPSASEVLGSDEPAREVFNPDRVEGGGAWIKLTY